MRRPRSSATPRQRKRALRWGVMAEWLALLYLMVKGYRPRAYRYLGGGGEVDLIMCRGDTIIFVEVKARTRHEAAWLAIDGLKTQKFCRTVQYWLMHNPWAQTYHLRADAVLISPWSWPFHVKDAFTLEP